MLRESEELKEFRAEQVRLQKKYHQMPMPVVTQWDVLRDRDGKVLWMSEIGLAKSWTRNAYNLLVEAVAFPYDTMSSGSFGDGYVSFKGVDGNIAAASSSALYFPPSHGASATYIMIGSGNTAESFDDYALATPIDSGTGAGQLTYGTRTVLTTWIGGSRLFRTIITRQFTNESGDAVSVAEKGLFLDTLKRPGSTTSNFLEKTLVQRDVLAAPASVPNGATWTAAYQVDSPAFPS